MSVTPDGRCNASFSRSIKQGRETTLGRGGGTKSLVHKMGADMASLYNAPQAQNAPSREAGHLADDYFPYL